MTSGMYYLFLWKTRLLTEMWCSARSRVATVVVVTITIILSFFFIFQKLALMYKKFFLSCFSLLNNKYGLKWVKRQWRISTKKSPFCCKYIARDIWPVLRASFRTNQLCVSISFVSIQKIYFARPSGAFALIQTSHLLEEAHFLDSAVRGKKSNLLQTITAFDSNDRSTRKVGHKVAMKKISCVNSHETWWRVKKRRFWVTHEISAQLKDI